MSLMQSVPSGGATAHGRAPATPACRTKRGIPGLKHAALRSALRPCTHAAKHTP